ncbi:MAG: substrate-binding domain-containing protein [Ignavibacteriae bacterium]|nr:substrate-binding domain-containing protein [Ignavibacteria bacterium]MBI3363844.1 substrate-binding domain-containing protein [Ignavibacteriota bacterium]
MNRKTFLLLFLIGIVAFSCGRKEEQKSTKTIGVSLLTRAHVFYKDLEEGLRTEAAKDGYELIVTAGEFDLGKQSAQIEDFITRKVDAIIVCPVDSRGIGPAIRKANEAKIPVFTADIASQEGDVVCHVASDNVAGGRLAGEYLAKLLNGKGNVAIIDQPTVTSVLDRVQGFKEAIAKFPDIKIVADVNGEGVRDRAMQAASDVLQAHPDLQGIFGINDDSALGSLDAVQQFHREGVNIIGYDAIPPAADAIMKGTALKADVIQYPKKIGETTVAKIKEYFSGTSLPKVVPVEVGIVDKEALQKTAAK